MHNSVNQLFIYSIIFLYVENMHIYFQNILIYSILHKKGLNIT